MGRRHNKVLEATNAIEQAHNGIEETESQVVVEVGAKYRKWQKLLCCLRLPVLPTKRLRSNSA